MTPACKVLLLSELLDIIFAYLMTLDPPSLVSAACVSKAWSDPALDALWYEVDNLPRLIGLLIPLREIFELVSYFFIFNEGQKLTSKISP